MKKLLLSLLILIPLVGCTKHAPVLPEATPILDAAQKDVRAGAISALGVLGSTGKVISDIAVIERNMAPSLPPNVELAVRTAIVNVSQEGLIVIDRIERAVITDWQTLRTMIDPFLTKVNNLVTIINNSGSTVKDKLAALGGVLLTIAVQLIIPSLAAQ